MKFTRGRLRVDEVAGVPLVDYIMPSKFNKVKINTTLQPLNIIKTYIMSLVSNKKT